jgi:hypothetical protein
MSSIVGGKKTTKSVGLRDPIFRKGPVEFPTLFPFFGPGSTSRFGDLTEQFRPTGVEIVGRSKGRSAGFGRQTTGMLEDIGPGLGVSTSLAADIVNPMAPMMAFKFKKDILELLRRTFPEDKLRGQFGPQDVPAGIQPALVAQGLNLLGPQAGPVANDVISLLSLGNGLQQAKPPPAPAPAKKETA